MPRQSKALSELPISTLRALEALGANLAVARLRRKESLASWASRLGVSVPLLMRLEAGDPSVSMGAYATALWQIGLDGALSSIASPDQDRGALELDIRQATELGRARAKAAEETRLARQENKSRKVAGGD